MNTDQLMDTAKNQVMQLTGKLQPRVDPCLISIIAKDPYTAKTYQEALLWRMEEMSRVTYEMLKCHELAVAATLARACVENAAAMWYL